MGRWVGGWGLWELGGFWCVFAIFVHLPDVICGCEPAWLVAGRHAEFTSAFLATFTFLVHLADVICGCEPALLVDGRHAEFTSAFLCFDDFVSDKLCIFRFVCKTHYSILVLL
ncbi:hypothetical protein [Fundicoccus culcitae]|uniref:Secreted protein n=1 Tax=Fundicoccus culcitae TaxID=2969821 RepID=A0ABY5P3A2_9LACT|nr:hypothetical protein [Fundicoccus culcitae]UUX33187.1 hypothetical protein NRE15_09770 [Fundicoccus culcitae]